MTDQKVKEKIGRVRPFKDFGERIRALRRSLNLDQRTLALRIGTKQSTVSEWEMGEYKPSPMALVAIGNLAGPDSETWFKEAGQEYAAELARLAINRAEVALTWDAELLSAVIEIVNANLDKKGRKLPPRKYAQLIVLIYEYCHGKRQLDSGTVERFLKIA